MALGATTTDDSGSPNPSVVGQVVQITAGVDAAVPPGPVPPAFVTFFDGPSVLGVAFLTPTFGCFPTVICSKSFAQISTSSLSQGSHTISAVFLGDASGNLGSSASYVQVVNAGSAVTPTKNATVLLSSTPNPSDVNEAVSFKATVSPVSPATATPTGFVHLVDGGFPLGRSQSINGLGEVIFTIVSLSPGTHSITAVYEGDDVYRGGSTSNVVLQVVRPMTPPTISKSFGAPSIPVGGSTSLAFTLRNGNPYAPLSGIGFSDTLPGGLVISSPNGLTGACGGGTITATAGSGVVSLSGAVLTGGQSCTFSANVTGLTAGDKNNTTGPVTSNEGGTGGTASAPIAVVAPPSIVKTFNPTTIEVNGQTTLAFTIGNPAANTVALAGVSFTDALPAGLVVSTPNGSSGSCGSGIITATAGSGSVTLSGGSIATGGSCTFSVSTTGTSPGTKDNSVQVASTNGGTGNTSNASVLVNSADLAVTKTGPATTTPGSNATYAISLHNNGPGDALFPVLTDALAPGTTFVSETHPAGWNCNDPIVATNGTMSCSAATLTNGATATFALTVHVNVTTASGTPVDNTATASATSFDPVSTNNSATQPTKAVCDHVVTGSLPGAVTLNGGSWCVNNAAIGGALIIRPGTTAVITNSTIGGLISATDPGAVTLCGSKVSGEVGISGATGFVLIGDPGDDGCAGNSIGGAVRLSSNHAGVEVGHNPRIGGSVTLTNNSGAGAFPDDVIPEVEANAIAGSLNCSGNSGVTNDGQPNSVVGARTGQCGAAGF
jgi:uncharacterized repeat protein (TIGR01451 family)